MRRRNGGRSERRSARGETGNDLLFGNQSTRLSIENLWLYNLPGVATFFFKGSKLDLPQDFLTVWKTRTLKP